MKIHTVRRGEMLREIAEGYGISEKALMGLNGIRSGTRLALGEELIVTVPTRTYTVKSGDTPERIALRFGIRKNLLLALNPSIAGRGLIPGETLILHISEPPSVLSASAGVLYRGASEEKLRRALPYLTYVAVSEAAVGNGKIKRLFDSRAAVKIILENQKIPLMRITDNGTGEKYGTKSSRASFIDELTEYAKIGGYKGIMLAASESARPSDECFAEFLVELRRKMIGEDLILITECDGRSPLYLSELADGAVFSCDRSDYSLDTEFDACERTAAIKFATDSESAKSFLDLSPFACACGDYITIDDALAYLRRSQGELITDEKTLMSSFDYRGGRVTFPSLKNIKAKLELSSELGFMGISFDILRVPVSHLAMCGASYKCVSYTALSSRGGCNREL